jgi:hypothetical protein
VPSPSATDDGARGRGPLLMVGGRVVLFRTTVKALFRLALISTLLTVVTGCWRSPCCDDDDGCAAYATCFEGTCRPRCEHKSECVEGELCSDGVCLALRRSESMCPFTPIGVLPFDAGIVDAGSEPVDAGDDDDAGSSLCTGNEEPNDSFETPSVGLFIGTFDICLPGDDDYFAIDVDAAQRIDARILFTHTEGDLDLELLAPDGSTIERSQGIGNEERIRRVVGAGGRFVLHVYGFADASNAYELSIVVEDAP